ncbi:MAG: sigma-54 dependent transcriptional regulator [candidate division Zixibacteria bacterium]|nr:sigma-54 dependent transcriptional regulator [candidate division Zixibacteria bacterium]
MPKGKILVVDDEESLGKFMQIMLQKEGYEVTPSLSGPDALKRLRSQEYDLVIADLMMPEMNGLKLLSEVKDSNPQIDFIVMTAFASVDTAIEAMKKGAFDYITKPFKVDEIKMAVNKSFEQRELKKENLQLRSQLKLDVSLDAFVGKSDVIAKVKEMVQRVAPTDSTVLLLGESGTGKELIARALHSCSQRADKPFVSINSTALPENLLESELFGHVKGSFTGAIRDKEGLFKVADGGTFFLDEIGETPPGIQVKLLRVLEEREITPVGGTKPQKVDVRIVTATNQDLEQQVKIKQFRADLFYRLNVLPIFIPPLRKRKDDIPILCEYFVNRHCARLGVKPKTITPEALQILIDFHWPGNVRELENTLERAIILTQGGKIEPEDLPASVRNSEPKSLVQEESKPNPTLEEMEKAYIFWILNQNEWNKTQVSQLLGIDTSTLYRKIEKYQLKEK